VVATSGRDGLIRLGKNGFESVFQRNTRIGTTIRTLLADQYGGIWAGTFSDGLWRIRGNLAEHFGKRDGLSGSVVQALLEDREGNIWAGTRSGLDRFRNPTFARISTEDGLSDEVTTAVVTSRDGSTWVGTPTHGLNRINTHGIQRFGKTEGLPNPVILSLYEDESGKIWAGTMGGLAVGSSRGFRPVAQEPGKILDRVTAITGDASGTIWLADARRGIFALAAGGAPMPLQAANLPTEKDVYSLLADRAGRLWVGYFHGAVAMIRDGRAVVYGQRYGPAPGSVTSIYEDEKGVIWVGSLGGLSRFRNGSWTAWTTRDGMPDGGVQTIVGDDRGELWLTTESGILRVRLADLSRQPDGAPRAFSIQQYGIEDGVRPQSGIVRTQPRVARAANGSLWFATEEGVTFVDPAKLEESQWVPRPTLDEFKVGGRSVAQQDGPMSFSGRELEFQYTTASLNSPDRVRFRYQLEGFDPGWIDAGVRRQAHYTNLSPGEYRFRLMVCSITGACGQGETLVHFVLQPSLQQRWWFRLIVACGFAALLWGLYSARVAWLNQQFAIRLKERLGERSRIARELHDTLLQSMVGISLQLDGMAQRLPPDADLRSSLERMRRHVDASLRDARQSVQALRSMPYQAGDLEMKLREAAGIVTSGQTMQCSLKVEGTPWPCSDGVEQEIVRVAQEAMENSLRHSAGMLIEVKLIYHRRSLVLDLSDNGKGMGELPPGLGLAGHFGIQGMRERAEAAGATIWIGNRAGGGTVVRLTVPRHRITLSGILAAGWGRATAAASDDSGDL
jgi:signal transduction histidine kinase/streptogramin lyase